MYLCTDFCIKKIEMFLGTFLFVLQGKQASSYTYDVNYTFLSQKSRTDTKSKLLPMNWKMSRSFIDSHDSLLDFDTPLWTII